MLSSLISSRLSGLHCINKKIRKCSKFPSMFFILYFIFYELSFVHLSLYHFSFHANLFHIFVQKKSLRSEEFSFGLTGRKLSMDMGNKISGISCQQLIKFKARGEEVGRIFIKFHCFPILKYVGTLFFCVTAVDLSIMECNHL